MKSNNNKKMPNEPSAGNGTKPHVMGTAYYWVNADKSTVQNYLKENVDDIDEYTRKKKEIMKRCFELSEKRFEKPNGVGNNLFIWTMFAMAIIGLIAAWMSL